MVYHEKTDPMAHLVIPPRTLHFPKNWHHFLKEREFRTSLFLSLIMITLSLVVNYYAGTYATKEASSPVSDIVLSNIPVFDVDGFFVYGAILFWIFVVFLCIRAPQKIPYVFKSITLFVLIRSLFIVLTHIGPYPESAVIESNLINKISFGGDLFFSGHTGLPYLMSLVFWNTKPLRVIFFAAAVFFGIVTLLAHFHYSIDVLSAFFITYTIYHIGERLFKKDKTYFFKEAVRGQG